MKKIICILLGILLVCLVSCTSNDIPQEKTKKEAVSNTDLSFFYSSNRLITENQAIFAELIKDNPIDKAYYSAESDGTTNGMIKIEVDYAEIWNTELEYSLNNFTALLNEEDKKTFESVQEKWEDYIERDYAFLENILNSDEYQSYMGTLFMVEHASEYRNAIRQRTLYIKYLHFCLASNEKDRGRFS